MGAPSIAFTERQQAIAVVVTAASVVVVCLLIGAPWPIRFATATAALYIVLSLFLHPRHSLLLDPFAIYNLSRLNVLVGLVFNGLYVAATTGPAATHPIFLAQAVALVSVMLADIGVLFLPTTPHRSSNRPIIDRGHIVSFLLLIYAAGWLWRTYALSAGLLHGTLVGSRLELTGASNVFGTLNGLATLTMWGCVTFAKQPRRMLPLIGAEMLWLLITGSKAAMLYTLLPFFMLLHRRDLLRIDRRFLVGGGILIIVFASSFVVIHGYRVAVAKQLFEAGYDKLDPIRALREITVDPADFQRIGKTLTERLNFAERFALIIERERQNPQPAWLGRSYLATLTWAVPRAVWPDKPSMSLGRYFATEYLGWGDESRSEAGITLWGEGYLNFGIIGALLAPAFWMVFLQALHGLMLGFGRWGLFALAASYIPMVNSLSANVALPVAAISQYVLIVLLFRATTAILDAIPANDRGWARG